MAEYCITSFISFQSPKERCPGRCFEQSFKLPFEDVHCTPGPDSIFPYNELPPLLKQNTKNIKTVLFRPSERIFPLPETIQNIFRCTHLGSWRIFPTHPACQLHVGLYVHKLLCLILHETNTNSAAQHFRRRQLGMAELMVHNVSALCNHGCMPREPCGQSQSQSRQAPVLHTLACSFILCLCQVRV